MRTAIKRPVGMSAFVFVWSGQFLSLIGSALTMFAMNIWVWQSAGTVTAQALVGIATFVPMILLSPIAGVIVDRWDRKKIMILSDLGAGISTLILLIFYLANNLNLPIIYGLTIFSGAVQAFQYPAYAAATSMMVPKKHYGRANGMKSMATSAAWILAPAFGGAIIGVVGVAGLMIIDLVTFFIAMITLSVVIIDQPTISKEGEESKGSFWKETGFGFRYIFRYPGLLGLQIIFFGINFLEAFSGVLVPPFVLSTTANNAQTLGFVLSAGGIGGVVGGMVMSTWGGPKNKIHGVLSGSILRGSLGILLMGLTRSMPIWLFSRFCSIFFLPIIHGSNQSIWQAKVPVDIQGRVFSAQNVIAWTSVPIAQFLSGQLADHVVEPGMRAEGGLARIFGGFAGVGPGAGFALMIIVTGALYVLAGMLGYCFPVVKNVETQMEDHDTVVLPVSAGEPI